MCAGKHDASTEPFGLCGSCDECLKSNPRTRAAAAAGRQDLHLASNAWWSVQGCSGTAMTAGCSCSQGQAGSPPLRWRAVIESSTCSLAAMHPSSMCRLPQVLPSYTHCLAARAGKLDNTMEREGGLPAWMPPWPSRRYSRAAWGSPAGTLAARPCHPLAAGSPVQPPPVRSEQGWASRVSSGRGHSRLKMCLANVLRTRGCAGDEVYLATITAGKDAAEHAPTVPLRAKQPPVSPALGLQRRCTRRS